MQKKEKLNKYVDNMICLSIMSTMLILNFGMPVS